MSEKDFLKLLDRKLDKILKICEEIKNTGKTYEQTYFR